MIGTGYPMFTGRSGDRTYGRRKKGSIWTMGLYFHNLVFNGIGQFFSEVLLRVLI